MGKWQLLIACGALVAAIAIIFGIERLLHTPLAQSTVTSPDGKFTCTIKAPWSDDTDTTAYITDANGKMLVNGIWRKDDDVFLLSAEWAGDECRLYWNNSGTTYFNAVCYKGRAIWLPPKSEEELSYLDGSYGVTTLELDGARFSDASLIHVGRYPKLESLFLGGATFTDSGLEHLHECPNLKHLSLGAGVTDHGLGFLRKCSSLEVLGLEGDRFTDAALQYTNQWPNLKELWIGHTSITRLGLRKLMDTRPTLKIYRRDPVWSLVPATVPSTVPATQP
jgi:hypothetical protein